MVSDRAFIFHMCIPCGNFFFGVKLICQCLGQISRSHYQKITITGALVFHKHSLFQPIIRNFLPMVKMMIINRKSVLWYIEMSGVYVMTYIKMFQGMKSRSGFLSHSDRY